MMSDMLTFEDRRKYSMMFCNLLISYHHRAAGSIFVPWISRGKNCAKMVDVRCEYCGNIISAHSDDFATHLQLESPRDRPTISASLPILRKNECWPGNREGFM